jgi:outer membrane receptor protein involved in Fe transport
VALGHTWAGANWTNEARLSYTRLRVFDVPESAFRSDVISELGIHGFSTDPFTYGLPFFVVTNFDTVTDSTMLPQVQRDNLWSLSDGISRMRGRHTIKTGFQWIHFQLNYLQSQFPRGQYQFNGFFTQDPAMPDTTGDPFADFLLGFPQSTKREVGSAQAYLRQNSYAAYVQDDWKVNSRLTLNLGVRYEYVTPYSEARNNLLNLDYSALPAAPKLVRVSSAVDPDRKNFAPRAGLAWRLPPVFGKGGDSVFRAGYGIYYSPEIAVETYDLVRNGLRNEVNEITGAAPVLTLQNGFPKTADSGFPSYFGLDPHARTPYVQQWNASVQHEFRGGVLLEIAYVGSKGTKLGRFRTFNTPAHVETGENLPPRPGDLQSLRTFPTLGPIFQRQHIANSSYHSLQIKAEKRFVKRLSFLASFVWSKSIDDADTVVPGQYDSIGAQDERNLRLERGLSFFNVGRRLSAGFAYDLPGFRRLEWLSNHWQLSGIITMQDGTPLNPVYFSTDNANSGTPNRPDIVPGQKISLPASQRTTDRYFNTDAFATPQPFTFGNAGRDVIPGPGNEVVDLALHRRFWVHETRGIEFRAESFNALNHPNIGIPGPYPDFGPFFGKIFSTGQPRRFQFAIRFDF